MIVNNNFDTWYIFLLPNLVVRITIFKFLFNSDGNKLTFCNVPQKKYHVDILHLIHPATESSCDSLDRET